MHVKFASKKRWETAPQSESSYMLMKMTSYRGDFQISQVKSIHKQQTTIRKPIECAPEASSGGREWADMTEGFHLDATRRKVLTYVPSGKK